MSELQPTQPQVTLVIIPRESFGYSCRSLADLYAHTQYPFELLYIDGGSPPAVRAQIDAMAAAKGFGVIRRPYYLSPNVARNLGLREVKTRYVVFTDNDIFFQPGWLERLVRCAEETGAAIVGPLTCIDEPLHEHIHNGGGESWLEALGDEGERRIVQKTHLAGRRVSEVADQLGRFACDYVEFHVMLARTALFAQIGPLDEQLLSTREHIDLCMLARQAGEKVICERQSVITYRGGVTLDWDDVAYYMLRWSDAWDLASLHHFRRKWQLIEDAYFEKRYRKLGARRYKRLMKPWLDKSPRGDGCEGCWRRSSARSTRTSAIASRAFTAMRATAWGCAAARCSDGRPRNHDQRLPGVCEGLSRRRDH